MSGKLTVIVIDDQHPEQKYVRVIPYHNYAIAEEAPLMIDATTFGSTTPTYLIGGPGTFRIEYTPDKP